MYIQPPRSLSAPWTATSGMNAVPMESPRKSVWPSSAVGDQIMTWVSHGASTTEVSILCCHITNGSKWFDIVVTGKVREREREREKRKRKRKKERKRESEKEKEKERERENA